MLILESPTANFISRFSLDKIGNNESPLQNNIEKLVDLIIARSEDRKIEEVANGLKEDIFNLRFDILEWLVSEGKDKNDYFKALDTHITVNLRLSHFSKLAQAVGNVLLLYRTVALQSFEGISLKEHSYSIRNEKPTYSTLEMLSGHPNPRTKFIKNWVDSSVHLDIGLILADLILCDRIRLTQEKINQELIPFLDHTIIHFGAYSIFTGYFTPVDYNKNSDINRMYILATTLELNNSKFQKRNLQQIETILNN